MARQSIDIETVVKGIISEVRSRVFKPVYVLMGAEPYYSDLVCDAIVENALEEWERDFNQTICYGADVSVGTIIDSARRYPMMADRQLIVVKDAQLVKDLENLAVYLENPLDTTVLVLLLRGSSLDKRRALYKAATKVGTVVESEPVRDYEMPRWISAYYSSRGLQIDYPAAQLLAEYAGTSLGTIAAETDKLLKNLPEGETHVTLDDIEKNVGVSREYSIFELSKALSFRDAGNAYRLSSRIASAAKFAMPAAVSALYTHFYRILKYECALSASPGMGYKEKAAVLGVSPGFVSEYDAAARNYPIKKTMAVISLLCDFDYRGKGGDGGPEVPSRELMLELTARILTI